MNFTSNLGYPRIGLNRELKFALEKYWQGKIGQTELMECAERIQVDNWELQKQAGIDFFPSNDFSLYDHVLDTSMMLGAIPARFRQFGETSRMELYFAMARGARITSGQNLAAMEMTKWFNTNYHYLVPEINPDMHFELDESKPLQAFQLAKSHNFHTRPVLLGPISFLLLSKSDKADFQPLGKLEEILPLYAQFFTLLYDAGADWVQLDEPFLSMDLDEEKRDAYARLFRCFASNQRRPKVMLNSYFGDLSSNRELVWDSPFDGLHIDLTTCKHPDVLIDGLNKHIWLSLGIIDGRNIWRSDLQAALQTIKQMSERRPFEHLIFSPSCSLMHIPQDITQEAENENEAFSWLAFARQKLIELRELKQAVENSFQPTALVIENQAALTRRKAFNQVGIVNSENFEKNTVFQRTSPFTYRKAKQQALLKLPLLPTTTIGSFPQTSQVRNLRMKLQKGEINDQEYINNIRAEVEKAIRFQEEYGLDVLVHGEFERNDMVQYFAEQMEGFLFTRQGWVQSFGSRCVRPPIIYGQVSRPHSISVDWTIFAQSLTDRPVKGMLTGPVTILQWSFVRDDQPRSQTCREIALAIREEVLDLERAGIRIIQIDEPALREGLPIHRQDWEPYLDWAVACFRASASGVQDETQIHTHMCYSEFNDIIDAIASMDADVISIEASRSRMQLLEVFKQFNYPNDIGPGVYDIHSPNVPSVEDLRTLIQKALEVIPEAQLWINPDCGLKTRQWDEVKPALQAMLTAVREIRSRLK